MKIADLGQLSGDVWLFGGVYSNLAALDAFRLRAGGAPAGNLLCSGDVVAYCARGADCVARVRALGGPVLAGNCEVQIAEGASDCGCGYDAGSDCSLLSRGWYAHALATIGTDDRVWMADLPERIVFTHAGRRWAMVHGGGTDIARFVWPVSTDADIATEIAALAAQVGPVDGIIAGHTGIPMEREVDGVRWVNPGALGMPPNDGCAAGCYAVLAEDGLRFERLRYDAGPEVAAMRAAGLVQGYDRCLETGWWPSEDTLPDCMRREAEVVSP